MNAQDWVLVITAVGTQLVAIITALVVLLKRQTINDQKTEEIHQIVNGKATAALRYRDKLVAALVENNIPVPPDDSLREVKRDG